MIGLKDGPDGYCRECRKMIPLDALARRPSLVSHYTFFAINNSDVGSRQACVGTVPDNTITHFMDDPKASFE